MIILTSTQEVDLAIRPQDARGNPAQIDGVPVWTSADESKLALIVAEDGLSAVAQAKALGSVQITVTADADLGSGVESITGLETVEIVSGKAVTLGIIAGTPREQAL